MQPIDEGLRDSLNSSSSSSTPSFAEKLRRDTSPDSSEIEEAIEMGDWAAVGATAAILASSTPSLGARIEDDDDSNVGSDIEEDNDASSSDSSGRISYGVRMSAETLDSDARPAKVDHEDLESYDVSTFHCILLLRISPNTVDKQTLLIKIICLRLKQRIQMVLVPPKLISW